MKTIYCILFAVCSIFLAACSSGNNNNNTTPMSTYAYITNEGNNSYAKCVVSQDGSLGECYSNIIKDLHNPTDIQFNNKYAYIINNNSNSYTKCSILDNGDLDDASCQTSLINGANGALKILFQENNAYIINHSENSYVQCSIDESGNLQTCASHNNLPGTHVGLTDISFNNNMVYFTADVGRPIQCEYNNGNLDNCKNIISSALVGINGISFNNNYAYLGLDLASEYSLCSINNNDLSCALHKTSPATGDYFSEITFNNNIAYLLHSQNNSYSTCNIAGNGILTGCSTNNISEFNKPSAINFYTLANVSPIPPNPENIKPYFYGLSSTGGSSYQKCGIKEDGSLDVCTNHTIDMFSPLGITFYKNTVYIVNNMFSFASIFPSYTICSVNPFDGRLEKCTRTYTNSTDPDDAFSNPLYEAKNITIGNNNKAYIALDDGSVESSGYSICNINDKMKLTDCYAYRNAFESMSRPYYISTNNNYAYITNDAQRANSHPNSYTICKINQEDGLLKECSFHENQSLNHPTNITFNNGLAYVGAYSTDGNNSYTICQIDSNNGDLINCQAPNREAGLESKVFTMNMYDNYAYTVYDSHNYSKCAVNSINNLLENCTLYNDAFGNQYTNSIGIYKYQIQN